MTLKNLLLPLSLLISLTSVAQTTLPTEKINGSSFHISTQIQRTVEKDLILVELYTRASGKSLNELKKTIAVNLNKVIEQLKTQPSIEFSLQNIRNYPDYDTKGKMTGWVAEGSIHLKSQETEAVAKILDNLGNKVAIRYLDFGISPEKMTALEDEMTQELIKQFQYKARLISKTLNAAQYKLHNVRLSLPNTAHSASPIQTRMYSAANNHLTETIPLEAGKTTLSATASGEIIFE